MFKNNLSDLDRDFIIVWARALVTEEYVNKGYYAYTKEVVSAIKKLAELGQINAIQKYYTSFNDNSPIIKNNIINIIKKENKNYEDLIAIIRYYMIEGIDVSKMQVQEALINAIKEYEETNNVCTFEDVFENWPDVINNKELAIIYLNTHKKATECVQHPLDENKLAEEFSYAKNVHYGSAFGANTSFLGVSKLIEIANLPVSKNLSDVNFNETVREDDYRSYIRNNPKYYPYFENTQKKN